jgi:DNA repair protein RecN (Recombination protein N)
MIKSIEIKNYALIDSLELQIEEGFTIITGETGAGKSIILGALQLILGQRADLSVVRDKNNKCVVEAIFDISTLNLEEIFKQEQIDYFENTIIRREITPDGRSRAFINDIPVNLTTLKDISEKIIDIHSQHDTLELNSTSFQTDAIDSFAKNQDILLTYTEKFRNYKKCISELTDLEADSQKEKAEFDYIQFQFEQINKANLKEDEQEILEAEQKQLSHTEEIKNNLSKICFNLNNENFAIISLLKDSLKACENISGFLPKAQEFFDRINTSVIDLQDLANEADTINNKLELDPERLDFVNSRLDTIYSLQNKFNVSSISELLELKNNFEQKLNRISSFDEQIDKKKTEIEDIKKQLVLICKNLSDRRKKSKKDFEIQIVDILSNLGMPNTKFDINIDTLNDFSNTGTDKIAFLFSANKNIEPQPITKIASGGELSRLMLAIKYIISLSKTLPTIVFDEIDTGVSGEIAAKMGILLQKMSKNLQIINITHLPQIAAKGNSHFLVYKDNSTVSTLSQIKKLNESERISEIAKMLSGTNITESAIENAKELLKN